MANTPVANASSNSLNSAIVKYQNCRQKQEADLDDDVKKVREAVTKLKKTHRKNEELCNDAFQKLIDLFSQPSASNNLAIGPNKSGLRHETGRLKRIMLTLMIRTAPRNKERATIQSIEQDDDLVEYESGYPMNEGLRTLERSPGTAMPSMSGSTGEVQNKTATASSKPLVIDLAGPSNSAFVQRGVKRKSQDPVTPRKKAQKSRPQHATDVERGTQNRKLMIPPPARRAAIKCQEKTKDLINFFDQPPRAISEAIQDRRALPIISCNCNQRDCPICFF